MTRSRIALAVLVLLSLALSAQPAADPVGNWKAVFTGPIGPRPKMVAEITFSIRSTPDGLKGAARASNWPGELEVSDIKFAGNRLSFTGTGSKGWSTGIGGVVTHHCCPRLKFDGTIDGDVMTLMLNWGSTENDDPLKPPLPMEAKRVSR
jgi:hypothetical protein